MKSRIVIKKARLSAETITTIRGSAHSFIPLWIDKQCYLHYQTVVVDDTEKSISGKTYEFIPIGVGMVVPDGWKYFSSFQIAADKALHFYVRQS